MIKIPNKSEIKTLYNEKLRPRLTQLEKARQRLLKRIALAAISLFLLYAAGSYLFWIGLNNKEFTPWPVIIQINVIIIIALVVILGVIIRRQSQSYRTLFKTHIVKEVFELILHSCQFFPTQYISSGQFDKSQLVTKKYNRYKGEDYVKGKIENILLEFCELKVHHETGSGKNRKNSKIFSGLFFECKFDKRIHSPLIIHADKAEKILGQVMGRFVQKKLKKDFELIHLDSVDFEKRFAVYGQDQILARVILNPMTMDKMVKFTRKFKERIEISLIEDRLYCIVHSNKNHFEPKTFSQSLYWKDIIEIYEILNLIVELINNLNLNVRGKTSV
jgi:hypothetical protein